MSIMFWSKQYVGEKEEGLRVSVSTETLDQGWRATLTLGDRRPVVLLLPRLEAMCQRILDELMLAKKHD